jgi:AcrR family transcriptional regulator
MIEERKLPRREREKQAQRQEMLAAALDLFSKRGYGNVSMQEIAEKSEFATGTLYKFFRSKEDLYRALLTEQSEKFHNGIIDAFASSDDEVEQLRNFLKVKGDIFRANIATIRIYFSETQGARHNVLVGFDQEMRRKHEEFLQALAAIFEKGMRRGRFRRIAEPYYLALAIEGVTNAFLLLWMDQPGGHPALDEPDTILNIFFEGLLA